MSVGVSIGESGVVMGVHIREVLWSGARVMECVVVGMGICQGRSLL